MAKTTLSLDGVSKVCAHCPAWNKVLLVTPSPDSTPELANLLSEMPCHVEMAVGGQEVVRRLHDLDAELAIWVRDDPSREDLEGIRALRGHSPRLPVIVVTRELGSDMAIELMKAGANDLIVQPFVPEQMRALVRRLMKTRQLMCEAVLLPTAPDRLAPACRLIGHSRPMQEVYKRIGLVAEREEPVLILGETGTGKELVARAIYQHSRRADRAFLAINCAALPESLLESELFGHEKGAFTGATHRRLGLFEQAEGGTIFLDEIGDMPLPLQAKILRVAQTGEFQRLGGSETIQVSVRLLAATHHNLEKAIRAGTFREDLYYRLNVVTIQLPPLREHLEDLLDLAEYFIARYTPPGQPRPALAADALAKLEAYSWPGNTRELENTIRRALVAARGHAILNKDIYLGEPQAASPVEGWADSLPLEEQLDRLLDQWLRWRESLGQDPHPDLLTQLDRLLIQAALRWTGGNQVQAAKCLGISRTTLRSHLKTPPADLSQMQPPV